MALERKSIDPLQWIMGWIVTVAVPVALTLSVIRLLFFPTFLEIEYRTPGFPADRYGFTLEDRLRWSQVAREYLVNDAGIEFLEELQFDDGTAVYNSRELSHMVDVKIAIQTVFRVWIGSLVVVIGSGIWAWRAGWWTEYRRALRRGGWLTVILIATILAFVMLAFGMFFVAFHNVFFSPGTWMFEWSDTLIRLFPERFWRDIFIYVGIGSALLALVLVFGFRKQSR